MHWSLVGPGDTLVSKTDKDPVSRIFVIYMNLCHINQVIDMVIDIEEIVTMLYLISNICTLP